MQETLFIQDLAVVLLVATVAGWLVQRLGLSAVVGYLLGGMLIGPFSPGLQLVSDLNHIQLHPPRAGDCRLSQAAQAALSACNNPACFFILLVTARVTFAAYF